MRLREGNAQLLEAKELLIKALASALNGLPPQKGTFYRGINVGDITIDEFKAKYKVGSVVIEPAFTSTSMHSDIGYITDRPVNFVIYGKSGVMLLDAMVVYGDETEVLFRPGTAFKVTKIEDSTYKVEANFAKGIMSDHDAPKLIIYLDEI